ncbi:MAG: RNA-binding protein [Deltaproteobacteria bacterium]|nr:RNA-binding protein [Deltaproteobacteria bacterium]
MKNIYVGNISYQMTEEQLTELFGNYGAVSSARVVKDNRSGRSKGFAFVEMEEGAEAAIEAINGTEVEGRTLRVAEAHAPEERERRDDGDGNRRRFNGPRGGGRGGYGNRGGGGGGRGGRDGNRDGNRGGGNYGNRGRERNYE